MTAERRRPPAPVVLYRWRPEWDERLRREYRAARSKAAVTELLNFMQRLTGFPRHAIVNRAQKLGLRVVVSRPWGKEETQILRILAETDSVKKMARKLHRSEASIRSQMHVLEVSCALKEGYSLRELAECLGMHHGRLERWVERGWLTLDRNGRVSDEGVEKFVRAHLEEVNFRTVDEAWLKGMLRPGKAGEEGTAVRVSADRFRGREQGTENREQGTGDREQGTEYWDGDGE